MEPDLNLIRLQQLLKPFENIGITNTSSASPFLKSMADIAASGTTDTDLVSQLKAEEAAKLSPVTSSVMYDEPQGLSQQFKFLPEAYNQSEDVEQVESLTETEPSGIAKLLQYLPFGEKSISGYLLDKFLPKESPEIKSMKNFYRSQYGLTPTGQVASGIMAGYNPVYGGALNMLTGGRFGKPMQVGLAGAMQKRIENILGRRAAQTDASRARVEELRNLQLKEMQDRSDRGESLSSIGKSTFTKPGMAFEAKPSGAYSKGFAGGR